MKKLLKCSIYLCLMVILNSCAVGAAASAASILSYAAETLTVSGEEKLIQKIEERNSLNTNPKVEKI